ncbi:MAG: 2-C-methyl-D-erythritol 4-phosphate cytidylyltransferase [Dehalococcoidales bacterium]|nr:2-C-methyl-D-erythritol 4-phosphate cytidylyltransferase [Dehalococcoidales bacterium]MDD3264846.1 2-C-methyl-D-erythritol 4-phosphate cytidylyltransferase [Dehalococcoidales bacterium]MDD4322653.1 2-C-methyl-D-erythritol 4-phosphate cytidylyltransferase [Dehalococcoidales bacterium]MDD4794209.1 2-C-methyl-D-erythritol 4-phosphate cytidylyltransferase [Dehalococcoidales bacterium]MDD5122298.1 2-C-methyl-D-erythritol 4-phosphate cytidylyltransferase [Dehalococcoidales bacterium]
MGNDTVSAVILGGGSSCRMGGADKLFRQACSKPLLYWSLLAFENSPLVDEIVVVLNKTNITPGRKMISKEGFCKVRAIVHGGMRRQDSVVHGLAHVSGRIVLIHDGARPMVSLDLIRAVAEGAQRHGACIPAVAVTDTIKTELNGFVSRTMPRTDLRAVQTPQAFSTELLRMAYQHFTSEATDDAQVVEISGAKVSLTEGSYDNIKVTTPSDLELVRTLIRKRGGVK